MAVLLLPCVYSKGEPIQNGQDKMNWRNAATFSNELGTIHLKSTGSWKAGQRGHSAMLMAQQYIESNNFYPFHTLHILQFKFSSLLKLAFMFWCRSPSSLSEVLSHLLQFPSGSGSANWPQGPSCIVTATLAVNTHKDNELEGEIDNGAICI